MPRAFRSELVPTEAEFALIEGGSFGLVSDLLVNIRAEGEAEAKAAKKARRKKAGVARAARKLGQGSARQRRR